MMAPQSSNRPLTKKIYVNLENLNSIKKGTMILSFTNSFLIK